MGDFGDYQLDKVEASSFESVPPGEYPVVVVKMEKKPTKDGTGERMNVEYKIAGGQFMNRTLFDGFNVKNKSAKAEGIGRSQLKAMIALTTRNPDPSIKDVIDGSMKAPFLAVVKMGTDQNGNPRSEIKSYKARLNTAPPVAEKSLVEQAFEPTEAAPAQRPW